MSVRGERLSKSFSGRRVLDAVDIEVGDGEFHALLGANGSGKSTLVKILTGVYRPDAGAISVAGRRIDEILSPQQANKLGIAVVHQEVPLIDTSTVAECVALFRGYPVSAGRVLWRVLQRDVAELFGRFNIGIDPDRLAGTLSPADRALVALVIALDRVKSELNLLVLDEATASLPRDEAAPYLDRIAAIARGGIGVLMVTHRLAELHGRAGRITILRDGRTAYAGRIGAIDDDEIVAHMVGASSRARGTGATSSHDIERTEPAPNDIALRVEGLRVHRLANVTFQLRRSEILGIAGLAESGAAELPQVLSGALERQGGSILVNGRALPRHGGPRASIKAGVAVLPADRLRSGGIAALSVAANVSLPDVDRYFLRAGDERLMVGRVIADFDVRPPLPQTLFGRLSGGNQQKALLGKWLHLGPSVLVLDDPTSGVDPAARERIFEILRRAAAAGVGILLLSTEPEQLAALCSRVLVLRDGAVAAELAGENLTHETISQGCFA